jgi:protoporphyrinogen oxidase
MRTNACHGRFFKYPLEPCDALRHLGPAEAIRCLLSYLRVPRLPEEQIKSFEDWVVNAFGRRLFEVFFKTYTEKVWGIPCSEISADWAAQRIRGLSLSTLLRSLLLRSNGKAVIKTLVDHFRYPARGPGEMWERVAGMIERQGGAVCSGQRVVEIKHATGASFRSRRKPPRDARPIAPVISFRPCRWCSLSPRWIRPLLRKCWVELEGCAIATS